jgi:hypothetical protein
MSFTFARNPADAPVDPASAGAPATAVAPASADPQVAAQRVKAGDLLVRLFDYLDANAEQHQALTAVIPEMTSAVAEYRAAGPGDPFAGVRRVLAKIESIRAADPSIPNS